MENFHEDKRLIHHFFIGAQFHAVEIGNADNVFRVVSCCQFANYSIDIFTNVLLMFKATISSKLPPSDTLMFQLSPL